MKTILGWNAALVLLVLVAAELIFGGWLSRPAIGTLTIARDVRLYYDWRRIRPGDGIAVYTRDEYGLRGADGPPSGVDLLTVGGSTTDELYIDDAKTWSAALERALRAGGRNLNVANAGVNGQTTRGHLASFDLWLSHLPGLHPRYVLFYVGINDALAGDVSPYDVMRRDGWRQRLIATVRYNSALFALARTVWGAIRARHLRVIYEQDPPVLKPGIAPVAPDRERNADRLAAYAERLRALAAWARRIGARPIFVTQRRGDSRMVNGVFYAASKDAARARAVLTLFNGTTLSVCRAVGAVCIDLAAELDLAPADFFDALHTNPDGSAKIGRFLAGRLKDVLR